MIKTSHLTRLFALLLSFAWISVYAQSDGKPNILIIWGDDIGPYNISAYNNGIMGYRTPNIDRIGAEGIRYDRAYSLHPVCVPARCALLTGLNAWRTHVLTNGNYLRPDHAACGMPTWAELLSKHGYLTSAIGKMHFYPWDARFGFEHRRGQKANSVEPNQSVGLRRDRHPRPHDGCDSRIPPGPRRG